MTESLSDSAAEAELLEKKAEIRRNVERLRAEIDGRAELLAATKTVPAELINYAVNECGIRTIGENRVNELREKYDALERDAMDVQFIGTLQSNKVKYIIDKVSLVHSLDSETLAAELQRQADKHDRTIDALVEINSAREPDKGGILSEQLAEFLERMERYDRVRIRGLMTIGPAGASYSEYKKYFSETYRLFIDILQKKIHNIDEPILSMGMSDSYIPAIECGASMVRIGSAIFGKRPRRPE